MRWRTGRRTAERLAAVDFWWHSIDVGGTVTPGHKGPELLAAELAAMELPDLSGKTVLDIGGWDGYFAFAAERLGASRVTVIDHYMWAMDSPAQQAYWRRCMAEGVEPQPYHETEYWHPDTLPGKAGFDTARELLESDVQDIVADFMTVDLDTVGVYDVVFYLGVLYHMENPLQALRRLHAVTGELAIIETAAVEIEGHDEPLWRFYPGAELNGDVSNWFAPNLAALVGACRSVGFTDVRVTRGPEGPGDYRATVHARKG
jgi:tRNA (mo5U34)-methyltransferase